MRFGAASVVTTNAVIVIHKAIAECVVIDEHHIRGEGVEDFGRVLLGLGPKTRDGVVAELLGVGGGKVRGVLLPGVGRRWGLGGPVGFDGD